MLGLGLDSFQEQLFEMIGRLRAQAEREKQGSASRAAAGSGCQMFVGHNPDRDKSTSKAASLIRDDNVNKVKAIHDFISSNGTVY